MLLNVLCFLSLGAYGWILRLCSGCSAFCLISDVWSCRCSILFCIICSLSMLVSDALGDHMCMLRAWFPYVCPTLSRWGLWVCWLFCVLWLRPGLCVCCKWVWGQVWVLVFLGVWSWVVLSIWSPNWVLYSVGSGVIVYRSSCLCREVGHCLLSTWVCHVGRVVCWPLRCLCQRMVLWDVWSVDVEEYGWKDATLWNSWFELAFCRWMVPECCVCHASFDVVCDVSEYGVLV